jgi:hypothetical protein
MTFAERLVAVANSQLGYRESEHNFIVRDDKSVQGWTFYGQWAGMPFEEWCGMFVSYCLEMAGIPRWVMPQEANCNRWKNKLGQRYIDDEDDYIPQPGDLIFFHHDRVSKDPNFPNHIGIVTGYDAGKNLVYTVEGNSGKSVRTHEYDHESSVIVGYASMRYCMLRWDDEYKSRIQQNLTNALAIMEARGFQTAALCTSDYHLRRTLWLARDVGMQATGIAAPSTKDVVSVVRGRLRETCSWVLYFVRKVTGIE